MDVQKVKKEATIIKNKDGFEAASNFILEHLNSPGRTLSESISLLQKLIPYYLSAKHSKNEALEVMTNTLNQYSQEEIIKSDFVAIGEVYLKIGLNHQIKFLEFYIREFINSGSYKDRFIFDTFLIHQSLFIAYIAAKHYDHAFKIMQQHLHYCFSFHPFNDVQLENFNRVHVVLSELAVIQNNVDQYFLHRIQSMIMESHIYKSPVNWNETDLKFKCFVNDNLLFKIKTYAEKEFPQIAENESLMHSLHEAYLKIVK